MVRPPGESETQLAVRPRRYAELDCRSHPARAAPISARRRWTSAVDGRVSQNIAAQRTVRGEAPAQTWPDPWSPVDIVRG
jgi:hypothetical protein